MRKYSLVRIMAFLLFAPIADATSQQARELCIQKTISRCLEQCEKTNMIDCSTSCPEIARNQCRQAGE